MITLTKLNNEKFILNHNQIQMIEIIPESKIVLMNREFFVVRETPQEIIDKILDFESHILEKSKIMIVERKDDE